MKKPKSNKLIDVVEVIEKNDLKVGAKNGSGFIYCGSAKELREKIDEIDEELTSSARRRIEENKRIIEAAPNTDFSYDAYKNAMDSKAAKKLKDEGAYVKPDYSAEGYVMWAYNKIGRYKSRITGNEKSESNLRKRKPIKERSVLEVYKSISEPHTMIMLIEGNEQGKAWTTDEYESKRSEEGEKE